MSDDLENGSTGGATTQPGTGVSQEGVGSTSNNGALLLEYRKIAREEAERAVQSTKDKRFSAIEKQVGESRSILERVKKMTGMSDEDFEKLEDRMLLDELKASRNQQTQTGAPASSGTRNGSAADEALEIIESAGFSQDDPDVISFLADNPSSAKLTGKLIKLGIERASKPIPSAAGLAPQQGTVPARPNDAQLALNYKQEVMSARGNKSAVLAIQKKYQDQGLDTGTIVLSV
jgi:hypothetical protein